MAEYRVTDKAGPFIAGRRHDGPGSTLFLTEREAAHDLRVGAIEPPPAPQAEGKKKGGASAK